MRFAPIALVLLSALALVAAAPTPVFPTRNTPVFPIVKAPVIPIKEAPPAPTDPELALYHHRTWASKQSTNCNRHSGTASWTSADAGTLNKKIRNKETTGPEAEKELIALRKIVHDHTVAGARYGLLSKEHNAKAKDLEAEIARTKRAAGADERGKGKRRRSSTSSDPQDESKKQKMAS